MSTSGDNKRAKKRVTEQNITEMKRRFLEGQTISAIARDMKVHRQTVSSYISERHQDVIADDIRKQLLSQELQNHFNQLTLFVRQDIRHRMDASTQLKPESEGFISASGVFGFPILVGTPHYITREWKRLYNPPAREQHLLNSLRKHTRDSKLWVYWDRWYKAVSPLETNSKDLWEWLEARLENDPDIDNRDFDILQSWIFGNIIREASGKDRASIEGIKKIDETEEFTPMVYGDRSTFPKIMDEIIEESKALPEFSNLGASITDLDNSQKQSDLRHLAKDIDFILAGIELMTAFPGKCALCPV